MINQNSDVSVVIPVRNRPAVIQRAIESAVRQTCQVREIVVVDDGSMDETPQVIERLAAANPLIRLLQQGESRGAPAARNRGAHTPGPFIAFLDSDDEWLPTHVERLRALLTAQPEAPAAFSNYLIEYRGRPTKVTRIPARVTLDLLLRRNAIGGSSLVLVRRTAFEAIGGFRESDAELPGLGIFGFGWLSWAISPSRPIRRSCYFSMAAIAFRKIPTGSLRVIGSFLIKSSRGSSIRLMQIRSGRSTSFGWQRSTRVTPFVRRVR